MCGNVEIDKKVRPLITVEELKVMKIFEAIILVPRMMPYRTTLVPDYKINWNLETKNVILEDGKRDKIKIFNLN